ncbi:uncharacterized protein EV420DRAFT_1485187 [Desarmillaria tabescens]|uniref:Uncharacterized protein n=1 Tax=Armillaria tabescens TaxID=1929756 RepID=A0AA39JJ81_ARMTA|nr:uncharacterized protein EV420DRAFT_1485187 [Desarmillaria tabescens]KAK0442766.1 hypothetical protein EV420DRAFT_1485187 [Desarmillaria tabescens]
MATGNAKVQAILTDNRKGEESASLSENNMMAHVAEAAQISFNMYQIREDPEFHESAKCKCSHSVSSSEASTTSSQLSWYPPPVTEEAFKHLLIYGPLDDLHDAEEAFALLLGFQGSGPDCCPHLDAMQPFHCIASRHHDWLHFKKHAGDDIKNPFRKGPVFHSPPHSHQEYQPVEDAGDAWKELRSRWTKEAENAGDDDMDFGLNVSITI